ncbi:odorant receptor 131-2-like [Myxocyprinus asiaticus]|uniref:odorant receptor 131-2-like n=1 Tax=Myxocyprinus asiaticus TaxID=70543 RepID=UPI0022219F4E|nr:odorant receptor 131-2-like [Myxocyprinus asiaticus]
MNYTMVQNNTKDRYEEAFVKNFIIVLLGITINSINGVFVFTFFRSSMFYNDSRYILYIHLVINDMLMVCITVTLYVMSYAWQNVPVPFCIILLMTGATTHKNTPLTLAGMAVERYIAICKPLHHSQICTVHRTYILISLIWGVGVIPGLADLIITLIVRPLSLFTKSTLCSTTYLYNTPYNEDKSKVINGFYTAVVWLILVFTYCRVLVTARKTTSDKSSAKKAQNTILLHGVQLMLCMLSYITPLIDIMFAPLLPAQWTKITFFNYLLGNIVPRLLTPLIYGVRDQKFLKEMKEHFTCKVIIL